jgi:surfactin synthase thioesterase subunit
VIITTQDAVVVRPHPKQDPELTLVCLGFCGGGTGSYHPWTAVVPPAVDLAAVCYPGRDGRFLEPVARDWEELALDAVAAVRSVGAEGPYVVFGHSMGGWMAFDVVARIERDGGRLPEALIVSAANAPSRGLTPRDMYPARQHTDEQLLHWMRTYGLLPEHVLADPDLQEMAVELMRADINVRDTFRPPADACVSVPLQILTGKEDPMMDPDVGEQWRELTVADYRHDTLPGGHFYTPEIWSRLPGYFRAL